MKISIACLRLALSFIIATVFVATTKAASAPEAPPVFNAVISTGKDTRFILVSPEGKTSEWIRLGANFEGYTLHAFDAATSTLEVEKNGSFAKLSLAADALVKEGPVSDAGRATLADAERVFQVMRFEEMMEKMLGQQKKQMQAMAQQMGSRMNQPGVNKDDFVAFQQKIMNEVMGALNVSEMKNDMAKIYTDVFTKDELEGQTAFYLTPAGRALIDKSPDVQARLQAVMMPRIQAVMPKVMQMGQQFQAEQQAKAKAAAAAAATPGAATPTPPKS